MEYVTQELKNHKQLEGTKKFYDKVFVYFLALLYSLP